MPISSLMDEKLAIDLPDLSKLWAGIPRLRTQSDPNPKAACPSHLYFQSRAASEAPQELSGLQMLFERSQCNPETTFCYSQSSVEENQ